MLCVGVYTLSFAVSYAFPRTTWERGKLNKPINRFRHLISYKRHWSLSNFAKQSVKKAVMFIDDYEQVLVSEAKRREFDGVICGHIHKAENRDIDGVRYLNCGDWVESCTAVVETMEGEWELFHFHKREAVPLQVN